MRASSLRIGGLAVLFFLLSVKGQQDVNQLQAWEIVNLPSFALPIKRFANQIAVVLLVMAALLSTRRRISFGLSLHVVTQAIILVWYYLRSVDVGSGNPLNYAAIAALAVWLYTISISSRPPQRTEFEHALLYFSATHVAVTVWIVLLGYGHTVDGATNRLYGLAYHPNMLGAVSSLSLSVFLFHSYSNARSRHRLMEQYIFPLLAAAALVLVVLSGSRTAVLMSLIPICFILPSRELFVLSVIAAVSVASGGLISILAPESALGAAIDRMVNAPRENRLGVWKALVTDFNAYPIWGAGDRSGVSASSYLTAFSGTGTVGGFFFITIMTTCATRAAIRIANSRFGSAPLLKPSIWHFIFLQISVASIFEAYMFDKFGLLQLLSLLAMNEISKKVKFR